MDIKEYMNLSKEELQIRLAIADTKVESLTNQLVRAISERNIFAFKVNPDFKLPEVAKKNEEIRVEPMQRPMQNQQQQQQQRPQAQNVGGK